MKNKSFFIVIEGIDGCGGTTHCNLLAGFLDYLKLKVYITQEPSENDIGLLLRKYLKNKEIHPATDALLFAADRSQHYLNEIKKKLEEGFIVISDRYIESSIAYQCAQSNQISIDWVKIINKFAGKPDLTIILDIDPKIALARKTQQDLEKFENTDFLNRVREIYLERAKEENYVVINSDDIIELVQEKIQKVVIENLKKKNII
ncbi:MAG: dTMP kinase [Promethearchaeota archaeon]